MMNKETLERMVLELQSRLDKHKYFITLLPGALLKRDIATGEIEVIESGSDEYDSYQMSYDDFLMVDMFGMESWEAIPDSPDADDREGVKNNPEKCWLLEHMHPGKTARQAWRREVRAYEEYMANHPSTSPQVNSSPIKPSIPASSTKPQKDDIIPKVIMTKPTNITSFIASKLTKSDMNKRQLERFLALESRKDQKIRWNEGIYYNRSDYFNGETESDRKARYSKGFMTDEEYADSHPDW